MHPKIILRFCKESIKDWELSSIKMLQIKCQVALMLIVLWISKSLFKWARIWMGYTINSSLKYLRSFKMVFLPALLIQTTIMFNLLPQGIIQTTSIMSNRISQSTNCHKIKLINYKLLLRLTACLMQLLNSIISRVSINNNSLTNSFLQQILVNPKIKAKSSNNSLTQIKISSPSNKIKTTKLTKMF